jgi:hypothetical protein
MMDRLLSLFVASCLAFLAWLYARTRDPEVLDNVSIPVQVSLASAQVEQYDLEVNGPPQVPVSFRGPSAGIRELRNLLQTGGVHVDLTVVVPEDRKNEARYGDTVRVDAADVHVPPGVTPLVIEGRNRIPVTLRKLVQRRLPVRLEPPPEDRVNRVVLEPATVLVRGPKVILDRTRSIPTQPYLPPSSSELASEQQVVAEGPVPLVHELEGRPITLTPDAVMVRLTFRPREQVYELNDVPVRFLCPADFGLRPRFLDGSGARISLRVLGPAGDEPPPVGVFVDLSRRRFRPGRYANQPLQVQMPNDFRLAQDPPHAGAFQLVRERSGTADDGDDSER